MLHSLTTVVWLVLIVTVPATASAEEANFGSVVNATVPLNEELLERIDHALTSDDLDRLKALSLFELPSAQEPSAGGSSIVGS
jgi:hypothetical protein